MAHYVKYTISNGALVSADSADMAPGSGQAVKRFDGDPVGGATWDTAALDYTPRIPPGPRAEVVRSRQKLSGTIASTAYAQGRTVKLLPMPGTAISNPAKSFVEGFWWHISAGTLAAIPAIFADVTGVNEITVVVNSPVAQTLTIVVGGGVIEYI